MVRQQLQDDGQQQPDQPAMEGGEEVPQKAPRAAAGRSLEVGCITHIWIHLASELHQEYGTIMHYYYLHVRDMDHSWTCMQIGVSPEACMVSVAD